MYKFLGTKLHDGLQRGYVAGVRWRAIDFQPLGSARYTKGRFCLWMLTAAAPSPCCTPGSFSGRR